MKLAVYVIHRNNVSAVRDSVVTKLRKIFSGPTRSLEAPFKVVGFTVVSDFDPESIPRDRISEYADISADGLQPPFDRLVGPMHINQLSNALKHYRALSLIAERRDVVPPNTVHLVLEDDVLYNEEIMEDALSRAVAQAPMDWDILFPGLPSTNDEAETDADKGNIRYHRLEALFRAIPSCESYVVTTQAAQRLASAFLPVRFATNIHLSWLILADGGNPRFRKQQRAEEPGRADESGERSDSSRSLPGVFDDESRSADAAARFHNFVVSPSIFLDGSKYGTCTSAVNTNNRLSWNPWYIRMFSLVRKPGTSLETPMDAETQAAVENTYASMNYSHHPDAQYLYALSHIRCKNYEKARDLMTAALRTYESNGCILNRGSEFLNVLCDLHKHLQNVPDVDSMNP